jgi:DNA-binding NtrC family response regulator
VQAKLLRVLQERSFERVGGNRTVKVDLRIVAATNRDLREAVADRRFREDLFFRIAVVILRIPPLRDRPSDVRSLAEHFLARFRRELGREDLVFGDAALAALERHSWPGNVRELQNAVERAAILAEGHRLEPGHFALGAQAPPDDARARLEALVGLHGSLDEVGARARDVAERAVIEHALAASDGNRTRAAQTLGVSYKRLLGRIRELNIPEPPAS